MDKRQTLRQEEALELVREYKRVIAPKVNYLIEPVLMEENEPSPLYRDVMRTGIAV